MLQSVAHERRHKWDGNRLRRLVQATGLPPSHFAAHLDVRLGQLKTFCRQSRLPGPVAALCDLWEESLLKSIDYVSPSPALNPAAVVNRCLSSLNRIAKGEAGDPQTEAREALRILESHG